jgi:hypothetical protein
LLNLTSDRRHEAKISHVLKVGVPQLGRVKHHSHVIDQTRLSRSLGTGGQSFGLLLAPFLLVRKDLWKQMNQAFPGRRGRIGKLLRVQGGPAGQTGPYLFR